MSSSGPEELVFEIPEEHTSHRGNEISQYVFSPNMQYVVTWSEDDQSIVGWSITDDLSNDLSIEPINSLNTDDLKSLLNIDPIPDIQLKRASDCKQFIILYFGRPNEFAVIGITNKSRQILNAQGLKDNKLSRSYDDIAFLENGDLAIAKGEPVYRTYIFSSSKFNGKYQWTCKNSIELEKYYRDYKCKINKNGTLFMYFDTPHKHLVMRITYFINFVLLVQKKKRLLITFLNQKTMKYVTYILNPLTYTLDKPPDSNVLHDILCQNGVINDYIIKIDKNDLLIKRLSQNENWKNYLQNKERYVGSSFFNTKEIKQFIQDTLDRYKSNQFLTQCYSDVTKEYPGLAYTWIVTNKYGVYFKWNRTYLKAQIKSNLNETSQNWFDSYDSADSYILEIKIFLQY
ncbi:hypothetical protein C2G38_2035727 [Gigaspora rosea]|uniref:Uncharacterized protein n=1 Tax=Gigaspora rosea TaxID=44941 RepID=A0A397VDE2_9GLOM|nr:hypothetical protein C2G38_2035727 [Gigaspora rosea]